MPAGSRAMQSTSANVPLTDLCAICHVNPIKYTCPRDGTHTCSLPCVKRHKQWAQCSGVRDPAEYRKRSELATPASVDKDFNFITKVERSLSRADDVAANRGIHLAPARLRPHDTRPKFELEAEARSIKVTKAPKGLSRSKQNKTHWGGQPKCIVWTVEWISQDGTRWMSAAPETKSIAELFDATAGSRKHTRKRKRPSEGTGSELSSKLHTGSSGPTKGENHSPDDAATSASAPDARDTKDSELPTSKTSPIENSSPAKLDPGELKASSNQYFYLHRPHTESRFKCLVPMRPTATLQECLNNRILLEYPTIYVLNEPPDRLQPPFLPEEEYIRRHGSDIPVNVTIPDQTTSETADLEEGELTSVTELAPNLDETRVLEVLAQDLGS